MNPVVIYILAYLRDLGETWTEAPTSKPDSGHIALTNAAGEVLTFTHRFNSGEPRWFVSECPERWRGTDVLDGLHPLKSPPKRRETSDV